MLGPCDVQDATCLCSNANITRAAMGCIYGTCTMSELQGTYMHAIIAHSATLLTELATNRVYAASCHYPTADARGLILIPTLTLAAVSTICVALRFITKLWVIKTGFQLDDYFLAVSYVSLLDRKQYRKGISTKTVEVLDVIFVYTICSSMIHPSSWLFEPFWRFQWRKMD